MQIADKKVVSIHYTLTNGEGEVIDSSRDAEPLVYLHGAQNIIPGLEAALVGKAVGDELEVSIEPADAYGEYNAEMTQVVPREMFEGVDELEAGMEFQAETAQGVQVIRIAAVDGDQITIDGNHPLAGVKLHFAVNVTEVREATEDELTHGHVHGAGCDH
ncbi:MAG: peptidylprolyl isomerase [Zetaproteobacteria bacterium CG12_big_fil_rev_8_21_14_0_65_54_13]|nr:MAG: peptidylprolyl isomerase [Zetaproteobacteria bacterium CG23_combo_of_CG06-09_8_20_14_all_54_7]PIW49195.1 MAG: peptidylprolyl isomerase [Zetaproteobacteria bacterium CG12_big_fil_rev_8_21_14_0_65_54_13]PIX55462.1 MAG: peptidylprolyl isomerase [Zetaproteobacteria bacterium CG_4_10_14_3_um_filter_54_28]PJA29220.1 MAG: peptidylprolyl isomerase [Zetaproteobacteria bacterium CG_4_9_14_3_um_filter_54_145]